MMKRSKSRFLVGAVLVGSLLAVASFAWACVSLPVSGVPLETQPEPALWPPVGDTPGPVILSPNPIRVPVGEVMGVSGKGWSPGVQVDLGLTLGRDGSSFAQSLGSTMADTEGAFSARVTVPSMPAGTYYLAAKQQQFVEVAGLSVPKSISVQRLTPAEVLPALNKAAGTTSTLNSTTGQVWSGFDRSLPAGDTRSLDLTSPASETGGDSLLTATILITGAIVASMAGYAALRTRRQKIRLDDGQ